MQYLCFETAYGGRYIVSTDTGALTHYTHQEPLFSGGWYFLGIQHTKRTRDTLSLARLRDQALLDSMQWLYPTSGTPQWTVIDRDHGTERVWGNTQVHGISRMWLEDRY